MRVRGLIWVAAVVALVLPTGARAARVDEGCASWDVTGTWQTTESNSYLITWALQQQPDGTITGTASIPEDERQRAGITSPTAPVTGKIKSDQISLIVSWAPHTDGSVSQGWYTGVIAAPGSVTGTGADLKHPGPKVAWSGTGPAKCLEAMNGTRKAVVVVSNGNINVVRTRPSGEKVYDHLGPDTELFEGDVITLYPSWSFSMRWVDGSTVTLRADTLTEIRIGTGAPASSPPESVFPNAIKLLKGLLTVDEPTHPGEMNKFELETLNAGVAPEGTTFRVEYEEATQTTTVGVESGKVKVTPMNTSLAPVEVSVGQQVDVSATKVGQLTGLAKLSAPSSSSGFPWVVVGGAAGLALVLFFGLFLMARKRA